MALDDTGAVVERLKLLGVPQGLDTEGLAILPNGDVAAATESGVGDRQDDLVLLLRREADALVVYQRLRFSYQPYGLRAEVNRGLEGLCHAEGRLIAAAEIVGQDAAGRYAPLAVLDGTTRRWHYARLRLHSRRGSLSALACRPHPSQPGSLEVLVVERHFFVSRLLRFTLDLAHLPDIIEAELLLDLAALLPGHPNIEGVSWTRDGRLALIADASWGSVQTDNLMFFVKP